MFCICMLDDVSYRLLYNAVCFQMLVTIQWFFINSFIDETVYVKNVCFLQVAYI